MRDYMTEIGLSADGSAVMINGVEVSANCHLCAATEKFALDTHKLIAYNKPKRWALHYGGTPKNPKRFFICDTCAKAICNGGQH